MLLPVAALAPGETFVAARVAPQLFSDLVFAIADTLASPELESAWTFASPLAVGQTSVSMELASRILLAAGKTSVETGLESAPFFAVAVAIGQTPPSPQLAATALASVWVSATATTVRGYISFG